MQLLSAYGPGLILLLLAAGGAIGVVGGLLGIGGGVIAVPVLLEVFAAAGIPDGERTPLAIGTAQFVIVLSSLVAAAAHAAAGRIDRPLLRAWTLPMVLGALAGLGIAPFLPPRLSVAVFALVLALLAASLLAGERVALAKAPPPAPLGWLPPGAIGVLAAALGVGSGTLSGPVLGLVGVPLGRAVGVGSAFNLAVALPASLGFALTGLDLPGRPPDAIGHVGLVAAALLSLPAMLAAPAAAKLAAKLQLGLLRLIFALCLFAIAARMLLGAIG